MIIFDLDDTLCRTEGADYENATPIKERIEKVNKLYDEGEVIVIWTARGSTTGIDWTELIERQLEKWGVKHHLLMTEKPNYKAFVCDKAHQPEDFFGERKGFTF